LTPPSEQSKAKTALPERLRDLSWEYPFDEMSWEEDRDLVIGRVLSRGPVHSADPREEPRSLGVPERPRLAGLGDLDLLVGRVRQVVESLSVRALQEDEPPAVLELDTDYVQ